MENEKLNLTNDEFQQLRQFVFSTIGVNLTEAKRSLVVSRLSKRLRELDLSSFTKYIQLAKSSNSEREVLYNLITTNVTKFFREEHHFDFLVQQVIPNFIESKQKLLRVWSSACSSGEEPYSIAITLDKAMQKHKNLDFKILASDINTEMLQKAKTGIYRRDETEGVTYSDLKKYFALGQGKNEGLFKVKEPLQKKIAFQRVNLVGQQEYPIKEKVHVIFCRNVFIYFNKETQISILDRFYEQLHPKGILMLGHSESIPSSLGKWRLIQKTIYEKID